MNLKNLDVDKISAAVEADAGQPIEGLRESLEQAKAGVFERITRPEQLLVRSVRAKTGLSQQAFAERIQTPVATLRDWEQGRFTPPGGVLCLLKLIGNHPDLIGELAAA